jgi:membrane protein implicated in regulation of membrane protease activity
MEAWQISLIIGLLLGIAELLTLSFGLLGMAVGMLSVAALQYWGGGLSLNRDIITFAVASAAAFLVFRMVFRRRSDQRKLEQDDINQY